MKVEQSAIKKYKRIQWFDFSTNKTFHGIDVVMIDNKSYHVMNEGYPMFFPNRNMANRAVRKMNKELELERSVAIVDAQRAER